MRAMPPIDALRDAYRWLDELTTDSNETIEALAAREGKTERSIRMTGTVRANKYRQFSASNLAERCSDL